MKKNYSPICLLATIVISLSCPAQNTADDGSALPLLSNDANHPCITDQEYNFIEQRCAENIQLLGLTTPASRGANVTPLNWPLKPASSLTDCDYAYISAGVDHNNASGAIKDYNCGSITYDGHGGTDISTWPYNFYKMDNNLVEVIAAAPGNILYKSDGHFDKYCAANSDTANYIIIRHADGSQANYWHMKKNSVTTKSVGQTVVAGEHLGFVGSSGNSSGPHLHFEVWSGSTSGTRVDPFAGSCNTLNNTTWWATQKPCKKTAVAKVSVNTTDIVIPACPATETTNESSTFPISFQGVGLAPGYAKFYAFILYDTVGINVNLSILNPNGTTFNSWTYTSSTTAKNSYRSWSKLLPTTAGVYTFKATHNGVVCSTDFAVGNPSAVSDLEDVSDFRIYPNPASNSVNIAVTEDLLNSTLTLTDITGRQLANVLLTTANRELPTDGFSNGVYFATIRKDGGVYSKKLMIQH